MKLILVIFSILFLASQSRVALVFGSNVPASKKAGSQNIDLYTCCKNNDAKTTCCAEGEQHDANDNCDDGPGCKLCHSPTIPIVSTRNQDLEIKNNRLIISSKSNDWIFEEQLPASVYFPIWSPPKLV